MPDVKITHVNGVERLSAEPGPAPGKPAIILNPRSGEMVTATQVMEEVQAVLRKHNMGLVHREGSILLGKLTGNLMKLEFRVLAKVKVVAPNELVMHEVDWTPKGVANG